MINSKDEIDRYIKWAKKMQAWAGALKKGMRVATPHGPATVTRVNGKSVRVKLDTRHPVSKRKAQTYRIPIWDSIIDCTWTPAIGAFPLGMEGGWV